ncbi:MAG TPA: hypothetical protein VIJ82_12845 [Streptosporangiaceae bacterium]
MLASSQAAEEQRKRDTFPATPAGAATVAKEAGQPFFEMITGETSTDRVFMSGEATAVSGVTVGVYLFRNTALPESTA